MAGPPRHLLTTLTSSSKHLLGSKRHWKSQVAVKSPTIGSKVDPDLKEIRTEPRFEWVLKQISHGQSEHSLASTSKKAKPVR